MAKKRKNSDNSNTATPVNRLWCCCMGYDYETQTVKVQISIPAAGSCDEYGEPKEDTMIQSLPFQIFPRLPKFGQSFLLTIRHDRVGDKGYPHIIYRRRKSARLDALKAEMDELLKHF